MQSYIFLAFSIASFWGVAAAANQFNLTSNSLEIDHLKHSSLVYGLLQSLPPYLVNRSCSDDVKLILEAISRKETWAMKVLDASGNVEAGFVIGNNHWLGSKSTCDSIGQPYKITMSERFKRNTIADLMNTVAPMRVQFRMVHARHASPWQVDFKFLVEHILHIGLCLPASCSNSEVHQMTAAYLRNGTASANLRHLDLNANILQVKDLKLRDDFASKKTVLYLSVLVVFSITMMALAGIVESDEDCMSRIISHFSVKKNLVSLYSFDDSVQPIPVIAGLKSIACFVLVIYHSKWFGFLNTKHQAEMFRLSEAPENYWVINGPLMVDIFFGISGFLMSYRFLENERQMEQIRAASFGKNVRLFGRMVLQRYLRFMPLCVVIMLSVEIVTAILADTSFFFIQENFDINCQRYWWRTALSIQNLFEFDEQCFSWSWSLACEMQFFVIFLALLFVYTKNKKLGLKIFATSAIVVFVLMLRLYLKHQMVPSGDVLYATSRSLYTNPLTRMAPYFPGVAGGWIYSVYKHRNMGESGTYLRQISLLSSLYLMYYVQHGVKRDGDYRMASTVLVVERWIFPTAGIALILSNMFGYHTTVTRFLSCKFFRHLNKLEYGIYLLNPLVVTVICGFADTSHAVDNASNYALAIADLAISYLMAVVCAVMFEVPFGKLVNELFPKEKCGKNQKTSMRTK